MAYSNKNARSVSTTQKFLCNCGGEIKMKSIFQGGRMSHLAECSKCQRRERRPSHFN